MEKSIAIITARGGSKRIPKKNIKPFLGKPIIAYSIEAAIQSGVFQEVMVSTDDEEIRKIALEYGASVPFLRTEKNANDTATTYQVLEEVVAEYEKRDKTFSYVCCIYPTAPFVTAEKLRKSMEMLIGQKADTVLPVVPFSFPPQRGFVIEEGCVKYKWPENALKRSQDLEVIYHDCGQYYCLNAEQLKKQQKIIMKNTVPVIMDEMEVQDIDHISDWKIAEIKYTNMMQR